MVAWQVGRTARANRSGWSLSFVTQYDVDLVHKVEELIEVKLQEYAMAEDEVLKGITKVCKWICSIPRYVLVFTLANLISTNNPNMVLYLRYGTVPDCTRSYRTVLYRTVRVGSVNVHVYMMYGRQGLSTSTATSHAASVSLEVTVLS